MILVGELEFNKLHFHVDGNTSFLFVGTSLKGIKNGKAELNYHYAISPYPDKNMYHVGDLFHSDHNYSVEEFLQRLVNTDVKFGRGVYQKWDDAKVRLKGMTNWIERQQPIINQEA